MTHGRRNPCARAFPLRQSRWCAKALAKIPTSASRAREMLDALMAASFDARRTPDLARSYHRVRVSLPAIWGRRFPRPQIGWRQGRPSRFRGAATALMGAGPWRWVILGSAGGRGRGSRPVVEQNQQGSCTECADRRSAGAIVPAAPHLRRCLFPCRLLLASRRLCRASRVCPQGTTRCE